MKRVYRVLRKAFGRAPFDGEGTYLYGGRWSSVGTRLSYTSEHQSLAMLEYFAHLEAHDAPSDLVLATAEIPNDLAKHRIVADKLPSHWRELPAPEELADVGDELVQKGEHCVLIVPSALAPHENNWLLNPQHTGFPRIVVSKLEPLTYDRRMFDVARRRGRRR